MTAELQDTWACDALVVEHYVTMTESETTFSIDDLMDIYEAIEARNKMQAQNVPQ